MYYYMPVPYGYGNQTVDFLGCHKGRFFAIEAKAPGKEPTPRQERTLNQVFLARGAVFTVDGPDGLTYLQAWLMGGPE